MICVEAPDVVVILDDQKTSNEKRKKHISTSADEYRARRLAKKSKYLQSPYDDHVEAAPLLDSQKNLLSYVWSHKLPWEESLFIDYARRSSFPLTRQEIITLQESESVCSLVIDNWTSLLNLTQFNSKPKKYYRFATTVGSSLCTLGKIYKGELTRTEEEAKEDFFVKMRMYPYYREHHMDIETLEYILMPAAIQGHFVMYVMNLKIGRYEYFTSKRGYPFEEIIETLGQELMKEARAYVNYMYYKLEVECPYNWEEWNWYEAKAYYQHDSVSCGVFIMKFLEEWDGDEDSMPSFRDWTAKSKFLKTKSINEFRMEICLRILTLFTNQIRIDVQQKANDFFQEETQLLLEQQIEKPKKQGGKTKSKTAAQKPAAQKPAAKGKRAPQKANEKAKKGKQI